MLPWIGYLASSPPLAESGGAWWVAGVGFDITLDFVPMTTAWLGFHRRQPAIILGLLVASTMLFTTRGSMVRSRTEFGISGERSSAPQYSRSRSRTSWQAVPSRSSSGRPRPSHA
jgi:hypothetical protein